MARSDLDDFFHIEPTKTPVGAREHFRITSVIWIVVLVIVLSVAGYCWLSAGVTYAVVSHLRGRKPGAVEILVQSLRAVSRLVLLALIDIIPILGMLVFMVAIAWLYVVY